jgi:hypothetical protein
MLIFVKKLIIFFPTAILVDTSFPIFKISIVAFWMIKLLNVNKNQSNTFWSQNHILFLYKLNNFRKNFRKNQDCLDFYVKVKIVIY